MDKEDRIIVLLEKILEMVGSIESNTSYNDNLLTEIKNDVSSLNSKDRV